MKGETMTAKAKAEAVFNFSQQKITTLVIFYLEYNGLKYANFDMCQHNLTKWLNGCIM